MGRLVDPVDDVLWCWNCNRASAHSVDLRPDLYGGWVLTTCKQCGEKQFLVMFKHKNGRLAPQNIK